MLDGSRAVVLVPVPGRISPGEARMQWFISLHHGDMNEASPSAGVPRLLGGLDRERFGVSVLFSPGLKVSTLPWTGTKFARSCCGKNTRVFGRCNFGAWPCKGTESRRGLYDGLISHTRSLNACDIDGIL